MASIPISQPNRSLFNHSDAGKGDQDRSPGWRKGYDEINWPGVQFFEQHGAKLIKRYPAPKHE